MGYDQIVRLTDYLEPVDWSGRIIREDKKGAIPEHLPAVLTRLDMDVLNLCVSVFENNGDSHSH